jgi:hypothetical protein
MKIAETIDFWNKKRVGTKMWYANPSGGSISQVLIVDVHYADDEATIYANCDENKKIDINNLFVSKMEASAKQESYNKSL